MPFSEDRSAQERVYEVCGAPLVESVLQGYNGMIFAYGQVNLRVSFLYPTASCCVRGGLPVVVGGCVFQVDTSVASLHLHGVTPLVGRDAQRLMLPYVHRSDFSAQWTCLLTTAGHRGSFFQLLFLLYVRNAITALFGQGSMLSPWRTATLSRLEMCKYLQSCYPHTSDEEACVFFLSAMDN